MRSGQFDGSNDDGYILNSALGSAESTAGNSPLQSLLKQGSGDASPLQKVTNQSPSPTHTQMKRSSSPAPMTGIATGTSPIYAYQFHNSFPFHETHTATAIKG